MSNDDIIETEFKQRTYDGKWERLDRVFDHDNAYTFTTESGQVTTLTPEKWICTGVYDFLGEFV